MTNHTIALTNFKRQSGRMLVCAWAVGLALSAGLAWGQSSSLYGPPEMRAPLTVATNSWVYLAQPPVHEIQLNDLLTVVVTENSQVLTDGNVSRREQTNIDANLQNWIKLRNFGLTAAPETGGDPRIRGTLNSQRRITGQMLTDDSVKFRIAARVVDIRPNGTLVIEAHKRVKQNDEVWERALSGIVRREDIKPDNTVMSEDIYELMIDMRDEGQIRDGYKQGWLLKMLDRMKPL
jgi:flagellar L-ring protein precursor FlgH